MRLANKFILAIALVLSACATTIQPAPTIVPLPAVAVPEPTPTNLKEVHIEVVNGQKIKDVSARFDNKPEFVLYFLDQNNLEIMTGNIEEMRRYILEQDLTIKYLNDVLSLRDAKTMDDAPTK